MKEDKKKVRERVRRWREKQKDKSVTNTVTEPLQSQITDADIKNLPVEVKNEIDRVTKIMSACGINNLRERQESAVRKLRGNNN